MLGSYPSEGRGQWKQVEETGAVHQRSKGEACPRATRSGPTVCNYVPDMGAEISAEGIKLCVVCVFAPSSLWVCGQWSVHLCAMHSCLWTRLCTSMFCWQLCVFLSVCVCVCVCKEGGVTQTFPGCAEAAMGVGALLPHACPLGSGLGAGAPRVPMTVGRRSGHRQNVFAFPG